MRQIVAIYHQRGQTVRGRQSSRGLVRPGVRENTILELARRTSSAALGAFPVVRPRPFRRNHYRNGGSIKRRVRRRSRPLAGQMKNLACGDITTFLELEQRGIPDSDHGPPKFLRCAKHGHRQRKFCRKLPELAVVARRVSDFSQRHPPVRIIILYRGIPFAPRATRSHRNCDCASRAQCA